MQYSLDRSYEILERTPDVLRTLLEGLDDDWVMNNEGPDTFSPYDVVGHLINAEKTNWRDRVTMILEFGDTKSFETFDRFAQYTESKGKSLSQLLREFKDIRNENLDWFKSLKLTEADMDRKGNHPALGQISLKNQLATWVIHDLTHISQITRVMAKQYKGEIGPWTQFFRILAY